MVFSLFKKTQEKMPERPVARPKAPAAQSLPAGEKAAGAPDSRPGHSVEQDQKLPAAPVSAAPEEAARELADLEFGDSQLDDLDFVQASASAIEVEQDVDPVQADIEQAAVLFANGQDSAARAVLEDSARAHTGANAERLWRMLLDLMQVLGDRADFEKLGLEFAQACETSPPAWREPEATATGTGDGETTVVLQGVISGADTPEIDKLKTALAAKEPVRIDFGKLASCDDAAAGAFCGLLQLARKRGMAVTLAGADGLVKRLETRLVAGLRESPASWLLLLEIYQYLGQSGLFEDKAVDYAVTFEVSPPSWEVIKAAPGKGKAPTAPAPEEQVLALSGELKNYRFEDLPNYLESTDQPVLDFSRVKRVDFFSAGLLRNTLEPFRRRGKEIVIRHPHHLVAELMGIVGLNHVARIIVPKF